MHRKIILALLLAGLALAGLYLQPQREEQTAVRDVPNCGLTDDFNAFLDNSGNTSAHR